MEALNAEKKQPAFRTILVIAAIFFVLTLSLSLNRYYSFFNPYDHGIFNQVFWNGTHGRFFQSSLSSTLSSAVLRDGELPTVFYHRLGQHFTPALLLWLPFYAVHPSAETLVVIQVVLMTTGGLVLYGLARQYLQPALASMIAASFYCANAVIGPTVSSFHDSSQTPLLVFSLLLALEKRVWWLFGGLAGLVLLVREDAGIILFGIGVYLTLSRRFPRVGLALCIVSFGYILLVTNAIMPLFSDDSSRRFTVEHFRNFTQNETRVSTLDLILSILSQPIQLIHQLVTPIATKANYLFYQWLPLAFVPMISGSAWVMAGFPLLALFIRDPDAPGNPLSIHLRYAITLLPGLFYGAILWWSVHAEKFRPLIRRFWVGCLVLSLLLLIRQNPHQILYFATPLKAISQSNKIYVPLNRQWQHAHDMRTLMGQIPPDASVAATTYAVPPLSSRREIIRLVGRRIEADGLKYFSALKLRNDRNEVISVDYVLADVWQSQQFQAVDQNERDQFQALIPILDQLIAGGEYGLRDLQDGGLLLQKGEPSNAKALSAWTALRASLPLP
ncbi:MAG: DUF2079 domain-containing protein [Scytolyngbya sp. HA4215-MV1]|nr:DUF2079 domain-containing protein [Scytolyngbya sp. HA4215-MV1]